MKYIEQKRNFIGFVTICSQRSGSKFLGSCFRAGSDIVALGEIFNPDLHDVLNFWTWLSNHTNNKAVNQVSNELLDKFMSDLYTQFGPFHFDLMYNQIMGVTPPWNDISEPYILNYLKSKGFYVIELHRNVTDLFISLEKLLLTNNAHAREAITIDSTDPMFSFDVNLSKYENFFVEINRWNILINKSFKNYDRVISLDFNELISNDGFLPDNLKNYISDALLSMNNVYGELIQCRKCTFGKSPANKVVIKNYLELIALEKMLKKNNKKKE
jgi:hypothetical protein